MSAPKFYFLWVVRDPQNESDFFRLLNDIHKNFKGICNLGVASYWNNFKKSETISRILLLKESGDAWTGFAAIHDGYQCFPDLKEPGTAVCTDGNRSWYVELICAKTDDGVKGRGSAMIDAIKRAAEADGREYVTLSALPYVVMWYYNQGFRLTLDSSCAEPPELTALAARIRDERKRFTSDKDAFSDPTFVTFLKRAVAFGLGANRHKYKNEMSGCDEKEPEDCASDGVYMTLCLPKKSFEFQYHPAYNRSLTRSMALPMEE